MLLPALLGLAGLGAVLLTPRGSSSNGGERGGGALTIPARNARVGDDVTFRGPRGSILTMSVTAATPTHVLGEVTHEDGVPVAARYPETAPRDALLGIVSAIDR